MSGKQNVLGLQYLSRYHVTIDFPNQRIYLAKGKHFSDLAYVHTCGLSVFFKAGGLEVESVDEKSPAYAAGFLAKDVIVKLCGKPIASWKPSEINRLLKKEGKPVQMTVERGGKRLEMSFTPKEYD
jgi:C-terminal processing protease CtpA/Prc